MIGAHHDRFLHRPAARGGDLTTAAPIRTGDRFRIGSNTKSFAAAVVLQLVGEGRLRLTDNVEHRLRGIYDYGQDPRLLAPYEQDRGHFWPPRELVALATSHPPQFLPGTDFGYSNTNYILLGLMIEAVTRRTAAGEIQRRLIRPLGLHATSVPQRDPHIAGRHTRTTSVTVNGHETLRTSRTRRSEATPPFCVNRRRGRCCRASAGRGRCRRRR